MAITTLGANAIGTLAADNMPDGSLILLHSVALGVAASEIAFNSTYITTAYDDYLMIGKAVTPATDGAEPLIRVSTDNGSSFAVDTDNGRQYTPLHTNTSQGIEINRHTDGSSIQLGTDLGNDANQGCNFHAHFFGLNSTSFQKFMFYQCIAKHQSLEYKWDGGANMETTSAINYLEFKFSSGNVAAGSRIALYGIKGSNHS
tara:strand:+ start:653 stop:1258 length:606 start_codon:yes stop_codon:yes gene_type:complete